MKSVGSVLKVVVSEAEIDSVDGVVEFDQNVLVEQVETLEVDVTDIVGEICEFGRDELEALPNLVAEIPVADDALEIQIDASRL